MSNVFWGYTLVVFSVTHSPPFHLKAVIYTKFRNVANSRYYNKDKSNKSNGQRITVLLSLPASLC
jgi:hypothetical protein